MEFGGNDRGKRVLKGHKDAFRKRDMLNRLYRSSDWQNYAQKLKTEIQTGQTMDDSDDSQDSPLTNTVEIEEEPVQISRPSSSISNSSQKSVEKATPRRPKRQSRLGAKKVEVDDFDSWLQGPGKDKYSTRRASPEFRRSSPATVDKQYLRSTSGGIGSTRTPEPQADFQSNLKRQMGLV
ncbi:hypothetical protein GEMRC1_004000 [Eukaryota sp. GEM-RC1]